MQCDTNPIRLLFLIIFLAVIVCFMKWNKSADFVIHRLTENKFHRYEQSDTKENPNPYPQTFCELDRAKLTKLQQLNISKADEDTFHSIVMDTFQTACYTKVRMGGSYRPCHAMDGQKYVCMDDLMMDVKNQECVVYSFGISGEYTFEETIASIGCKVYAYDPTIDAPTFKYPNIKFKKIGLSGAPKGAIYKTFLEIISENGHSDTKISYLKMDIEGDELSGLRVWLESGSLANVQQIAMEYHVNDERKKFIPTFLAALRDLQIQENFRMFNWEANNCWSKCWRSKYVDLGEIVLKRVDPQTDCAKK